MVDRLSAREDNAALSPQRGNVVTRQEKCKYSIDVCREPVEDLLQESASGLCLFPLNILW